MSRATAVYFVMFAVLIVGLWAILRVGNRMRPPEDLAGRWELRGASGTREVVIGQSGRFFDVAVPGAAVVRMTMSGLEEKGGAVSMTIGSGEAAFTASGEAGADEFRFDFGGRGVGGLAGSYEGRRVARRYAGAAHGRLRTAAGPSTGPNAR